MSKPVDVAVVLPTYNEVENIPLIVPEIHRELEAANITYQVWVMDDDSPDGTAIVAQELAQTYPVHVCCRKGGIKSLSAAVLDGFSQANAEVLVVMDADLSHPVSALPRMIQTILSDQSDIVVGSRHMPGGGSTLWPWYRRLVSRVASWLTFGISPMTDPTSGFMAVRKSILNMSCLRPLSWKIVLETVVKHRDARLSEVPIMFTDRRHGDSKMSLKQQLHYMQHLLDLYDAVWPSFGQFVRYSIVGLSGVGLDFMVSSMAIIILATSGIASGYVLTWAALAGFFVASTTNYIFNRLWTFRQVRDDVPFVYGYIKYLLTTVVGLTSRLGVSLALSLMVIGAPLLLVNVVGIIAASLVNFFGSKYLVFRSR